MNATLENDFEFYLQNQEGLVQKYGGRIVAIRNGQVVGYYATEMEAVRDAGSRFPLGSFLIQKCEAGSENYSQRFTSRVSGYVNAQTCASH